MILKHRPDYREIWNEKQKDISEALPIIFLSKILPDNTFYKNVYYKVGKNWVEVDGLLEYNGILFVIQVKGGKYNPYSPLVDANGHFNSIIELVLTPAIQAKRFIDILNKKGSLEIYDDSYNKIGVMKKDSFNRIIPFCVTLDHMTFLTSRASALSSIINKSSDLPMWAISIDDLMVISDIFEKNPLKFCHYMEQRWKFIKRNMNNVYDEVDHLGLYLKENHYVEMAEELTGNLMGCTDTSKAVASMVWNGYSTDIDKYFSELYVCDCDKSKVKLPEQETTKDIEKMMNIFNQNISKNNILGSNFFLDCDLETRNIIAKTILSLTENIEEKNRPVFSHISFPNYPHATFVVFPSTNGDKIRIYKEFWALLYRQNSDERYLFLIEVKNGNIVGLDTDVRSKKDIPKEMIDDIKEYSIEQAERIISKNKKRNIGRNEMCQCGSGKKYKHCCLNIKC